MLIDTHTHCFPDALAPKAINVLSGESKQLAHTDGTLSGLISSMDEYGVDKSFVLNIATNPHQQENVNKFAAAINNYKGRIISFGSITPDCPDKKSAAKQIKESGLYGIKLHPDFMSHDFADDAFSEVLSACAEYDLTVIIHAGLDFVSLDHVHATPEMIASVCDKFPSLRLVCAHFGANFMYEKSAELLSTKNIWIDTAYSSHVNDVKGAKKVFAAFDNDRIMFATDSPWETPADTMAFIDKLGLSAEQKEKLFYKNAEGLIDLSKND